LNTWTLATATFHSSLAILLLAGCGESLIAEDRPVRDDGTLPELDSFARSFVQPCDLQTPPVPSRPGSLCESDGLCWESPMPGGRDLKFLAKVGKELWTLGAGGLMRFDGTTWLPQAAPLERPKSLCAADSRAVFITQGNSIARFDGAGWQTWELPVAAVGHVFCGSATNVWAMVERGLMRFDGTAWNSVPRPPQTDPALHVVAENDVWAFSTNTSSIANSYVSHYDGASWADHHFQLPIGLWAQLTVVGSSSPKDVWVGGHYYDDAPPREPVLYEHGRPFGQRLWRRGVLLRWNGSQLARVEIPPVSAITAIWGRSPDDVWFGTNNGEYLHWDGISVKAVSSPTSVRRVRAFAETDDGRLFSIASGPDLNWYTESGAVLEWDGTKWSDGSLAESVDYPLAVWGSAWNDVWAVGTGGLRMHFDGSSWTTTQRAPATITSIWGTAQNDVWAVGVDGTIQHFDGSTWSEVHRTEGSFTDIWGTGDTQWITGDGADGGLPEDDFDVARWNGSTLKKYDLGLEGARAVWASSSRDVWVAGTNGLRRFDGFRWNTLFTPLVVPPRAIWGRSADDVWVVHGANQLYHYDGHAFTATAIGAEQGYDGEVAIWGCGEQSVFVACGSGIGHYDGTKWTTAPMHASWISGVWGASADYMIAVGWGGQILRRSR
jgi:hypothetical protein